MGSRGLGQLAYDKGMRVLAASKAQEAAIERGGRIQQGLLTYALVQEGLERQQADFQPPDGRIELRMPSRPSRGSLRKGTRAAALRYEATPNSRATAIWEGNLPPCATSSRSFSISRRERTCSGTL
jgi:hypothetical protein